jgi:hypothetical protein
MIGIPVASDSRGFYRRAWYGASVSTFVHAQEDAVLGQLARANEFDLTQAQRDAWATQIAILQSELADLAGAIFLEYSIPRMGRRIDTVLVIGPVIFVVEFKVGERDFDRGSIEQVWDYALDLKNFHRGSHEAPIVPILIATEAASTRLPLLQADPDGVYHPVLIGSNSLRRVIEAALASISGAPLDGGAWAESPYHPTPTIVEAARALYANHSVEAIARSDASARNLHSTSSRIEALIEEAQKKRQKLICFVTGVPGAGKTLVGLNVATRRRDEKEPSHAVFLSGNGPLVAVLREALTRDEVKRRRERGESVKKGRVGESVKAFIQNVHHFRDDALGQDTPLIEHVVIFDEAQRAWNLQQTAAFMQRKKSRPGFDMSEPEFLISCMDRHKDWSVVVCLVGGGQEINIGEAGIGAWLEAIEKSFPDWRVHISDRLTDSEYAAGHALSMLGESPYVYAEPDLHLAVSMRSFRAEHVSAFVKAVLDCEERLARQTLASIVSRYPIMVTRDLHRAREWVRERARGSERYGIVASSKAQRLKPHAVDIRVSVDPVHYFLSDRTDTRSSFYLEDAATEFQVQGLELDWACVTWDGDLRYNGKGWSFHDFRGSRWTNVLNDDNRNYLRNAYRVLLTRARQGMVIFVPPGDTRDPTRAANIYDPTFNYLAGLGVPVLS